VEEKPLDREERLTKGFRTVRLGFSAGSSVKYNLEGAGENGI